MAVTARHGRRWRVDLSAAERCQRAQICLLSPSFERGRKRSEPNLNIYLPIGRRANSNSTWLYSSRTRICKWLADSNLGHISLLAANQNNRTVGATAAPFEIFILFWASPRFPLGLCCRYSCGLCSGFQNLAIDLGARCRMCNRVTLRDGSRPSNYPSRARYE